MMSRMLPRLSLHCLARLGSVSPDLTTDRYIPIVWSGLAGDENYGSSYSSNRLPGTWVNHILLGNSERTVTQDLYYYGSM